LQAFKDKVASVSGVYTDIWDGVESAFNVQEVWPACFVAYTGCDFDMQEELGVATWVRNFHFAVYVCTTSVQEALEILDRLEEGLVGERLMSGLSPLSPDISEELVAAEAGYLLYVQGYMCEQLESRR